LTPDSLKLATLVVLPFVFAPFLAEQRELPRQVILQAVAFGALGYAVARGRLASKNVLIASSVFVICLVLFSLRSDSPGQSLYGPYQGHTGALAWCALIALVAAPPSSPERFRWAMVAVGLTQAAIGLVQRVGGTAPVGTLGHPMFLAGLLLIGALVTLERITTRDDRRVRVGLLLVVAIQVAALVLTARRGPVLALAPGALVLLAKSGSRRRLAAPLLASVIVAMAAGGVLPVPGYETTPAGRWRGQVVEARHDTLGQRRDFYRVALSAIEDQILAGHGFGAFEAIYASNKASPEAPREAHVHNIWLSLLLAVGLLGAGAFVALVLFVGREIWPDPLAVAVLAAYLAYRTFNFDQPAVAAWAFVIIATAVPVVAARRVPWLGFLIAAAGFVGAQRIVADHHMATCLSGHAINTPGHLDACADALAISPHECWYHRQTARVGDHEIPGWCAE